MCCGGSVDEAVIVEVSSCGCVDVVMVNVVGVAEGVVVMEAVVLVLVVDKVIQCLQ